MSQHYEPLRIHLLDRLLEDCNIYVRRDGEYRQITPPQYRRHGDHYVAILKSAAKLTTIELSRDALVYVSRARYLPVAAEPEFAAELVHSQEE